MYAVTTQDRCATPPRSPTIRGSAVPTMRLSSIASSIASSSPGSTIMTSRRLAHAGSDPVVSDTRPLLPIGCRSGYAVLTYRPASNSVRWLLTGRQVNNCHSRVGGEHVRAADRGTADRYAGTRTEGRARTVRRAWLRENLVARDRRTARHHQGRALLPLQ